MIQNWALYFFQTLCGPSDWISSPGEVLNWQSQWYGVARLVDQLMRLVCDPGSEHQTVDTGGMGSLKIDCRVFLRVIRATWFETCTITRPRAEFARSTGYCN